MLPLQLSIVQATKYGHVLKSTNAFQFIQGLETLPLRMTKHVDNAKKLANWLRAASWLINHADLQTIQVMICQKYLNGQFPTVFTFGLSGDSDAAKTFIDSVKLASHLANVGDAKTLVIHPASTTHPQLGESEQQSAGVKPDMIRVSVERHIDDIYVLIRQFQPNLY